MQVWSSEEKSRLQENKDPKDIVKQDLNKI